MLMDVHFAPVLSLDKKWKKPGDIPVRVFLFLYNLAKHLRAAEALTSC